MASKLSRPKSLLTRGNPKLQKNVVHTVGLSLAAGAKDVCPFASAECRSVCLMTAGRGRMSKVAAARARRLQWWREDPTGFKEQLLSELIAESHKHTRMAVRLNVLSDIRWEKEFPEVFRALPDVTFYDYTKWPLKARPKRGMPKNYSLTFSYDGHNEREAKRQLKSGRNVAIVFRGGLPPTWWGGIPVRSGDLDDQRWADEKGVIIGLKAKGKALKSGGSFVVRPTVLELRDGA